MPAHLTLDAHLAALAGSGAALSDAAARAGLAAAVPTCPGWDVRDLIAHQGMVHRWAAANLRGEPDPDTDHFEADGKAAPDPLAWFEAGLAELIETLRATPDDAEAMVFLKDAPPPRRFWARRQAHETTIHGADALAAALGRAPTAAEMSIAPELAADGIDELLTGFITRRRGRLRAQEPYTVVIRTDEGHAWTVRVSAEPVETTVGGAGHADAVLTGTAAQLYLGLWNRSGGITATGRADIVDQWREQVRVTWTN